MNASLFQSIRVRAGRVDNVSKRQLKGDLMALIKEVERLRDINAHLSFELNRVESRP